MAVTEFKLNFVGEGLDPRLGRIKTTDNLATVVGAGYLNPLVLSQGLDIRESDFLFVAASDGNQVYQPSINAGTGVITLVLLGI